MTPRTKGMIQGALIMYLVVALLIGAAASRMQIGPVRMSVPGYVFYGAVWPVWTIGQAFQTNIMQVPEWAYVNSYTPDQAAADASAKINADVEALKKQLDEMGGQ